MEKRLYLAFGISILVLVAYAGIASRVAPPPPVSQGTPVKTIKPERKSETENTQLIENKEVIKKIDSTKAADSLVNIQNDDLDLTINQVGASIKKARVLQHNNILSLANISLLLEWQGAQFISLGDNQYKTLQYKDLDNDVTVIKTIKFTENKFIVEVNVELINDSKKSKNLNYSLNIASLSEQEIKKDQIGQQYVDVTLATKGAISRGNFFKFNPPASIDTIEWVGVRDRYYCVMVKPNQPTNKLIKLNSDGYTSYAIQSNSMQLAPGESVKNSYLFYIGPQNKNLIGKLSANSDLIVNYGFFDSIAHMLLAALRFFYSFTHNWGISIILFSIAVFLILSPMTMKSFKSMKNMQKLQPEVEALKGKYKDDAQKLNKAIMELYREKGVNPISGCLPIVLQMPIFIALYQLLLRFVELKGSRFMWIRDLSEPDKLMVLPNKLPIISDEINLLPVIMMIAMLIQQKLTSAQQSQGQMTAQQQKMMSLLMSLLFGIIFYHMPSGLVLYWTVNSVLMAVAQVRLARMP